MTFTLESFASDVHRILQEDPSPVGREKVRNLVQEALKDEKFVGAYVNDNTPDRQVIYEDPELGFCICAHVNRDPREANPHDHGSSWAIYGQALKHTEMSEWKRTDDGSVPGKAAIEKAKTYRMERGQSGIFQNRAIHSIAYPAGARFIRVTGTNLENIARGRYNSEAGTMVVEKRPNFRGAT